MVCPSAEPLQLFKIDPLDLGHYVGIARIECREEQIVRECVDLAADETLGRFRHGETAALGAHLNIHAERLHTLGYGLAVRYAVVAPARGHDQFVAPDIPCRQACRTAYAVAAHARLRAVGIEHAHAVAAAVECQQQHSVAADALRAVARRARQSREIRARRCLWLCYGVDQYEIVARAVALYELQLDHLSVESIFGQNY